MHGHFGMSMPHGTGLHAARICAYSGTRFWKNVGFCFSFQHKNIPSESLKRGMKVQSVVDSSESMTQSYNSGDTQFAASGCCIHPLQFDTEVLESQPSQPKGDTYIVERRPELF